jgi:hypothetical protein
MQAQLPYKPDYRTYTGSTSALAAAAEFAEREGALPAERRATDAERILLQAQLPPRPDPVSYIGSTSALAADAEFAEPGGAEFAPERRARDAERAAAQEDPSHAGRDPDHPLGRVVQQASYFCFSAGCRRLQARQRRNETPPESEDDASPYRLPKK